eukprot:Skav206129  [mRNA]  locus=scaffold172:340023:340988:+ [translate_table: standard]
MAPDVSRSRHDQTGLATEVSQNALNLAFTNNAADPADRVVANGFAVTAETVGKAIGPIAFSAIYAWSLTTFGWDGHGLVFYILALISADIAWLWAGFSLMQIICVLCLPSYIEHGREEAPKKASSSSSASNCM